MIVDDEWLEDHDEMILRPYNGIGEVVREVDAMIDKSSVSQQFLTVFKARAYDRIAEVYKNHDNPDKYELLKRALTTIKDWCSFYEYEGCNMKCMLCSTMFICVPEQWDVDEVVKRVRERCEEA